MSRASSFMPIQYRIDRADRIQFLNEAWLKFACQNDGAHLNRAHLIGKSLWEFVDGEEVRGLYGQIFKMVRMKQRAGLFRFRCDSPICRRYFLLTVSPLQEEALMLSTHSIGETPRKTVPLLDPELEKGEAWLRVCSWCMKACLSTKEWVELEEAVDRLDLLGGNPVPSLMHAICPDCHIAVEQELQSLRG